MYLVRTGSASGIHVVVIDFLPKLSSSSTSLGVTGLWKMVVLSPKVLLC